MKLRNNLDGKIAPSKEIGFAQSKHHIFNDDFCIMAHKGFYSFFAGTIQLLSIIEMKRRLACEEIERKTFTKFRPNCDKQANKSHNQDTHFSKCDEKRPEKMFECR